MSSTPFYIRHNELSDGSELWEVWQNGGELRLASAETRDEAVQLRDALNAACVAWSQNIRNTVDV